MAGSRTGPVFDFQYNLLLFVAYKLEFVSNHFLLWTSCKCQYHVLNFSHFEKV